MSRPIITLTTDWGTRGFFIAKVKGALLSAMEDIQIVDVTHEVVFKDVREASFIIRQACLGFPPGTVHIVDVGSDPLLEEAFVVVKVRDQYFIGPNNGLITQAFDTEVSDAVCLPMEEDRIYNFVAYTLFCPAAVKLLSGMPLSELGVPVQNLRHSLQPSWVKQGNTYRIPVIYTDSYGNAYLGMTYREFINEQQGRPFVMQVRDHWINELLRSYQQKSLHPQRNPHDDRKLCLTVSVTGLLELATCNMSLERTFGLHTSDYVLLEFR